jgi:hypothetical protein
MGWGPPNKSGYLPMAATTIDTQQNPVMDEGMYVEPVIAYRCWLVKGELLTSWTKTLPWIPHEHMEAECMRAALPFGVVKQPHDTPNVHGCGLYGVRREDQAERWAAQSAVGVLGVVKMWGRVIVCEDGYLAQFAYPAALLRPCRDVSLKHMGVLAERYGIPVEWPSQLGMR